MALMELTLKTGRNVYVRSLLVGRTYEGLLMGVPNESMIPKEIHRIRRTSRRAFGVRPCHVLSVPTVVGSRGEMRLPPKYVAADCWSYEPAQDETRDASALAVIWFQEEFPPILSPANEATFQAMPWDSDAQDFDW